MGPGGLVSLTAVLIGVAGGGNVCRFGRGAYGNGAGNGDGRCSV
jgi:hypothetical protein